MARIWADYFAAQVVFQAQSGLPRDRFVNRFHFRNNVPPAPNAGAQNIADIVENIRRFYFGQDDAGNSVARFMNPIIQSMQVRIYDLGQPVPRAPIVRTIPLEGDNRFSLGFTPSPLPLELAACVTWTTDVQPPRPGELGKRGRGRTYVGPLTTQALSQDTLTPILSDPFVETLAAAGARLLDAVADNIPDAAAPSLTILSETYGEADRVRRGWVNNEFDIQRRRQNGETRRVHFTDDGVVPAT